MGFSSYAGRADGSALAAVLNKVNASDGNSDEGGCSHEQLYRAPIICKKFGIC